VPQLIIRNQKDKWEVELGDHTKIGRVLINDVCLEDTSISRFHAEIIFNGQDYLFKDLGSSNGSYINDVRIKEGVLSNGSIVRIGKRVTLTFIEDPANTTPAGLVRIASTPISEKAILDQIKIDEELAFTPAHLITGQMDWREDYEKLRLASSLLQNIEMQRDLSSIMENIALKLLDIFPADRCAILLLDAESDELVPVTVKVLTGIQKNMSISKSILEKVRKTHSALIVSDACADERFSGAASVLVQGLHSVLCAPIICSNNFYGVIHLDCQKSAMVFSRKDLKLITSLTSHVARIITNSNLLKSVEKEAKDKAQLERLLPPSIIEKVAKGEIKLDKKGGKSKQVTILFADIRGFTKIAHHIPATQVVEMLNEYFEIMVNVVFQYGGTVDKFIGDELMVLFGALTDVEHPADQAVKCAFHMHGALELFNKEIKNKIKQPIKIGIGINTGDVVVGAIGASRSMQYTCIGDAVNIAARLTSVAKEKQTVISEDTYYKLKNKPKHDILPKISLKGIDRSIQLYSVWESTTDSTIHM
jgi:adenylate cyclase